MPIKSPIYFRNCLQCNVEFPYKKTARVRSSFSVELGVKIACVKSKFCSRKCSIGWFNKHKNPAKTLNGKLKISQKAKQRGIAHLLTPEARKKQQISISGNKHWNWQGGITIENRRRRNLKEYKLWRGTIFNRDNYTCQFCGARNGNGKSVKLQADHIKPWSLYPDLRLDISNGRTLCIDCHKKTDTYMGRIKKFN